MGMTKKRMLAPIAAALALSLAGCLSVCRVPIPHDERFSDDGECTNRVWRSLLCDLRANGMGTNAVWRIFPTVQMRCRATEEMCRPVPDGLTGERLYDARMARRWRWIPLGFLWLAAPADAAIDLVAVPHDLCVTAGDGDACSEGEERGGAD